MNLNHVLAFNTARWNKTVTEYPWPGPKWMKENQTVLNNFTCYFKAFREPAPTELPLTEKWLYNLNKDFVFIMIMKIVFVIIFEVIIALH